MDSVTPRKANGKVDWAGYIRTTWPIIVGILLAGLWLGGRMESPEEKLIRIQGQLRPLEIQLNHLINSLDEHRKRGGHEVMERRMVLVEAQMENVSERLDILDDRVAEILLIVRRMENGRP